MEPTKVGWPVRETSRECFGISIGEPLANWRLDWRQVLAASSGALHGAGAHIAKVVWWDRVNTVVLSVCSESFKDIVARLEVGVGLWQLSSEMLDRPGWRLLLL